MCNVQCTFQILEQARKRVDKTGKTGRYPIFLSPYSILHTVNNIFLNMAPQNIVKVIMQLLRPIKILKGKVLPMGKKIRKRPVNYGGSEEEIQNML